MPVDTPEIQLISPESPAQWEATRLILRDYAQSLPIDLCFQNFEQELASLPGEYAGPQGLMLLALAFALLRGCSRRDDCQSYKDAYGEASSEYQQCQRNSSGSGVRIGSGGGSYGGYSSGGGGHK